MVYCASNIFKRMINMDIKQQILHYYRIENLSQREIAKKVHVDRKTVKRVIQGLERALTENPGNGEDDYLSKKPRYRKRPYSPRVMKGAVIEEIERCLRLNEQRKIAGMRKQCLRLKDIHRTLVEKGYRVSYSSVCKYVSSLNPRSKGKKGRVYLRMHREHGLECEFDWGEVKLKINGVLERLMMAFFVFPYSQGRYAYVFHRQDALAFAEAHRNFFKEIQGVPREMVYDNMRVAVRFEEWGKEATVLLQRLSTYYCFRYRFCNLRAGWEKGNVERSVEYVRRRAFAARTEFGTIEEAQRWLSDITARINAERCGDGADGKLSEELASLQPYPGEFGCFEVKSYRVDSQSTVYIKRNHYSVPDRLAGKTVLAKLYSEKIVFYDGCEQVAVHERSYGTDRWVVDIAHYVDTLLRKTGAMERSEAFHQMHPSMKRLYHTCFKDNAKEFLRTIKHIRDNDIPLDAVMSAAESLKRSGVRHFTVEQIRVALQTLSFGEESFREDQKTDQFLEIEMGSEDILTQLENVMEKGIK